MKKQGAMRSAPSEQCDYVFEGSAPVLGEVAKARPVDEIAEQNEALRSKFSRKRRKFWEPQEGYQNCK